MFLRYCSPLCFGSGAMDAFVTANTTAPQPSGPRKRKVRNRLTTLTSAGWHRDPPCFL
jgi:hypothetical protein